MFSKMIGMKALVVVFIFSTLDICAQAILAPPFGLQWGDTPDKVLKWAEEKELDVVVKIPGKNPETREFKISAEGTSLPQHQAYMLEARYHWGKLYEVTLHYGSVEDKPVDLKAKFEKLKAAMVLKYGLLKPNKKQSSKKDGYNQEAISYHVEPVSGLLLLMSYTEIKDELRGQDSARFSLLYRNHNLLSQ